jgi:hypothetical protein
LYSKGRFSSPWGNYFVTTPKEELGDAYVASFSTHVDHDAWLVDSGASFDMTPHREWFYTYERYDGGNVFLGDE